MECGNIELYQLLKVDLENLSLVNRRISLVRGKNMKRNFGAYAHILCTSFRLKHICSIFSLNLKLFCNTLINYLNHLSQKSQMCRPQPIRCEDLTLFSVNNINWISLHFVLLVKPGKIFKDGNMLKSKWWIENQKHGMLWWLGLLICRGCVLAAAATGSVPSCGPLLHVVHSHVCSSTVLSTRKHESLPPKNKKRNENQKH